MSNDATNMNPISGERVNMLDPDRGSEIGIQQEKRTASIHYRRGAPRADFYVNEQSVQTITLETGTYETRPLSCGELATVSVDKTTHSITVTSTSANDGIWRLSSVNESAAATSS